MTPALPSSSSSTAASRYSAPGAPPDRPRGPGHTRSSVQSLEARIRRYNSDIDSGSDTFRAAVLLLASLEYGQNVELLARRTGYQRSFVAKCARRLIDNGVWSQGRTVASWSVEDEASGAFWNDVAVAEGKLCRRANPDGEIEWAPAGYWKKSYEFIESADQPLTAVYRDPAGPAAAPAPGQAPQSQPEPTPAPVEAGEGEEPVSEQEKAPPPGDAVDPAVPAAPAGPKRPPDELFPGTVWLG